VSFLQHGDQAGIATVLPQFKKNTTFHALIKVMPVTSK
jgi:hypothetical protein